MGGLDLQQLGWLFYSLLGLIFVTLAILIIYVVVANRRQRARLADTSKVDELTFRSSPGATGHILSLVREEAGGALLVEIGGVRYRRLADIEEPQSRRQVVDAALELIRFTGVVGQSGIAPSPVEKTKGWREDLRASSKAELESIHSGLVGKGEPSSVGQASEEVEQQFLELLSGLGESVPIERPSIAGSIQQRLRPKPAEPEQPRTFVHDIDDIIQRRIRLIPALQNRDLHVRLGTGDTVRFVLEGKEYERLEDVPNLTARQLIEDAIQEWEETS